MNDTTKLRNAVGDMAAVFAVFAAARTELGDLRRAEDQFKDKVKAEACRRLATKAASQAVLRSNSWIGRAPDFIQPLTKALIEEFWSEVRRKTQVRRGVEDLVKLVDQLDGRACLALLCELAIAKSFENFESKHAGPLLKALDLDRLAVEREVAAELKAKKKAGKK